MHFNFSPGLAQFVSQGMSFRINGMCLHITRIRITVQVSMGYFLTDLAMILWYFPSLGGKEYVSLNYYLARILSAEQDSSLLVFSDHLLKY